MVYNNFIAHDVSVSHEIQTTYKPEMFSYICILLLMEELNNQKIPGRMSIADNKGLILCCIILMYTTIHYIKSHEVQYMMIIAKWRLSKPHNVT